MLPPDDPHLNALTESAAQAEEKWLNSHAAVRERQVRLDGLIGEFLGEEGASDFVKLDTQYPIVLLPVRIETRVQTGVGMPVSDPDALARLLSRRVPYQPA